MTKSLVLFLLLAAPLEAERLQPDQIKYLGHFSPPASQGDGDSGTWRYGPGGLTMVPDCLGLKDPTPDDGFPGCIGAFGHKRGFQFGVFDIPRPGGQAKQVVPFYELGSPIVEQQLGRRQSQYWDVLYDRGEDHCRLWWTFGTWYVKIQQNPPFLGVSTCEPERPNPVGLWGFDKGKGVKGGAEAFHTAKMYQGLSLIPREVAEAHFDGKQMMLGISRRSGTRGGSQGPSLYVRHLETPSPPPPGPIKDATPLVWYRFSGFMEWYGKPQMSGPVVHWWTKSKAQGAEFIRVGNREAVVLPWREPTIDPDDYPCSDPLAYRDDDPTTPEPCKVPVCWYGAHECIEGPKKSQTPSFWETKSDGTNMPTDCKLTDPCSKSTGPHCLSVEPFLIFYDLGDLAAVYRGNLKHHEPQPYAKVPLEDFLLSRGSCSAGVEGSTYDPTKQVFFISQGGRTSVVHMIQIVSQPQSESLTP